MVTQNHSEIALEIESKIKKNNGVASEVRERLKRAEQSIRKNNAHKNNAKAEERQRILATLAGIRKRFVQEMDNIKNPEKNPDILLVLNAKIVAIEQAIEEIEAETR